MPARDYRIYCALLHRADWETAEIPDRFQPRSVPALADWSRMSRTAAAEGLNHLERHGWVTRVRMPPGRGRSTRYILLSGSDCDCGPAAKRAAPTPEAKRAREYRARKKASGIHVTQSESSHGIHVTKRPGVRDESAGQGAVSAEGAREKGRRVGEYAGGPVDFYAGWPADSIGAEMNGER